MLRRLHKLKLYGDLNLHMVPRLRVVYHFESAISLGLAFGVEGVDPIVDVIAEVDVADLPPSLAEFLNRVLP